MSDGEQRENCGASAAPLDKLVQAISRSQHRYRELIDNLDLAVFTLSPDGEVLVCNRLLAEIFGARFDQLIGHRLDEFLAEPGLEGAKSWVSELIRAGSWSGNVSVRLKRETHVRQFACWFQPVFDEGGMTSVIGWARDVTVQVVSFTERNEIERRLRQEQEFVRRLIDSHPDVISVLDCEGRIIYASRRLKEVMGIDPADYAGMPVGDNVHPDDRERVVKHFQDFVSGKSTESSFEFRALHADSTWRTLRVTVGLMRDDENKVTGIVVSTRDVTEVRLAQNQIAQKEKLTAMGQMLVGAAHELNNPLTAILGVGDLLRERASDEVARRHAELILLQARRAATIVQNLVSFSRPFAQGLGSIRVEDALRQALEHQQESLLQQHIRVEYQTGAALPVVNGDSKLLTQVFENILTNAAQAISSVRSSGVISVSTTEMGEFVRVSIGDNGPGIPAENISRLFDPFFTTKRPGGGVGLGLTIGMAVIKEHGGHIEVFSKNGEGATFEIFLPRALDQGANPNVRSSPSATIPSARLLHGHTVLVVDDEENIREIVQEGLSTRGMIVRGAESAEAALTYLTANPSEVVLCDFNLPGLSGEKLFERVHGQRSADSPLFIFMTGELVDAGVVDRIHSMGARVLQKPFAISALLRLLAEVLQASQPVGAK